MIKNNKILKKYNQPPWSIVAHVFTEGRLKMAILWCTLHMCASLDWTENSFLTNCYQFHKWIYIPPKNIFVHNTELETLFIIDQGCWKWEGGGLEEQASPPPRLSDLATSLGRPFMHKIFFLSSGTYMLEVS